MIKIGIIGVTGRMGKAVEAIISSHDFCECAGGVHRDSSAADLQKLVQNSDIIVDFSTAENSLKVLQTCLEFKTPLVIGTTGLSAEDHNKIQAAGGFIPVFYASNFCMAIHLLAGFIAKASDALVGYDASILETHHKAKKDAPSGTAKLLADKAGISYDRVLYRRCGKVVGEHEVAFYGEHDKLVISHEAYDRTVFAEGAVRAAIWLLNQPDGYYTMEDMLWLKSEL